MNANWTRFNKYLYKYWRLQAVVIFLGLIATPLSLINPYLTKLVIDNAYANKDLKLFFILAVMGGSIFVLNTLIHSLSGYLSQRINCRVHFDMTKDMFRHLQSLSMSFFSNQSTGEHIYRISNDVHSVSGFICNTIPQIITLFPRLLFILAIVFYLNWKWALLAFLLVPLSYIQPYFFGKWLKEITWRMIEKSQGIFRSLQEVFSHIHLVKALGREDYEIKRFQESLSKRIDFEIKNARLSNISNFSNSILNKVITGIIALYGGYQVIKGSVSLGSLTAVMIYMGQMMGLIRSIGDFYQTITVNSVSCQRLKEIFDIEPEIKDKPNAIDYQIPQGKIEFRNVYFGYKQDEDILKDLSSLINGGAKISLVGPSGCGKTTLLCLILRLYEPKQGSILIDDLDTRDMKLKSLKEQIGIAPQEPFLWNDSVVNNILYGKEDALMNEVIYAAKLSLAHNFILRLPQGYKTLIGENACKISEGQKQRIAIARAVIKRPKILILDEAMSSLDSENEDKIIDNLKEEFKDSTIILVSHRLSSIRKMDRVYFLNDILEIEIGIHGDLMERSQKYRELFASQVELENTKINI